MKRIFLVHFLLAFSVLTWAKTQGSKERIFGYWTNENQDIIIHIFESSGHLLQGKIVWMKDSLDDFGNYKLDVQNADSKLRSQKLLGAIILKNYKYDTANKIWRSGKIYNFETGNTYRSKLWVNENGALSVKGYWWFFSFLGKTKTWVKDIPSDLLNAVVKQNR